MSAIAETTSALASVVTSPSFRCSERAVRLAASPEDFVVDEIPLYAPSGEDLGPDPLTPIQVARVSPRDSASSSSRIQSWGVMA